MKLALVLAGALTLVGCGSKNADPYAQANLALLDTVPVYPGGIAPKTTASGTGGAQFAARDWALPVGSKSSAIVDWYEQKLQAAGWKITGKSFGTLRATRNGSSLSIGVRGAVLEAIANSRGA